MYSEPKTNQEIMDFLVGLSLTSLVISLFIIISGWSNCLSTLYISTFFLGIIFLVYAVMIIVIYWFHGYIVSGIGALWSPDFDGVYQKIEIELNCSGFDTLNYTINTTNITCRERISDLLLESKDSVPPTLIAFSLFIVFGCGEAAYAISIIKKERTQVESESEQSNSIDMIIKNSNGSFRISSKKDIRDHEVPEYSSCHDQNHSHNSAKSSFYSDNYASGYDYSESPPYIPNVSKKTPYK